MFLIGLGALLVLCGVLYMIRTAIWRGPLSGRDSSRPVRDTLEPPTRSMRFLGVSTNWPGILLLWQSVQFCCCRGPVSNLRHPWVAAMNNPDQEILIRAVEDARRILGEYIEPGPRDATRTVERLLAVLDRNDIVHALDRAKRRRVIRLVE